MSAMVVRDFVHFGLVASARIAELCIVHGVNRYPNSDSKGLSTASRRCHVFVEDIQRSMYLEMRKMQMSRTLFFLAVYLAVCGLTSFPNRHWLGVDCSLVDRRPAKS